MPWRGRPARDTIPRMVAPYPVAKSPRRYARAALTGARPGGGRRGAVLPPAPMAVGANARHMQGRRRRTGGGWKQYLHPALTALRGVTTLHHKRVVSWLTSVRRGLAALQVCSFWRDEPQPGGRLHCHRPPPASSRISPLAMPPASGEPPDISRPRSGATPRRARSRQGSRPSLRLRTGSAAAARGRPYPRGESKMPTISMTAENTAEKLSFHTGEKPFSR